MSEIELKPCPFCDWPAERKDYGHGRVAVQCGNIVCRAHSMLSLPGEDAVEAWNTRSQSERVSRLEEALTPSAATKAAYIGEFSFLIDEQDDEQMCEVTRKVDVPWTTIKEIMAAILARSALNQSDGGGNG